MIEAAVKRRYDVWSEWCGADRCTIYHLNLIEGKRIVAHTFGRVYDEMLRRGDSFVETGEYDA